MSLDDYIQKCAELLQALEAEMPTIADEVAMNALALVKNRIIDQREGIAGASYSTKLMLATKDQFVVKSAFKQSTKEVIQYARKKDKKNFQETQIGKMVSSKSGKSYKTKKVKKKLWVKFPGAKSAVPVMELPKGYREFREIQGRPGDHVNLSLSGKMWQGTTIVARVKGQFMWMTVVGGNNKEAQDKLSWMTLKYGDFLAVEPDEKTKLVNLFNARTQAIVNRIFV